MNHCGSQATLSRPLTFWHKQVDPSGCYDNLVTVRSFVPHYHLAGGVNLPKIIDCVGSDGAKRRQLVKVGGVSTCVDVPLCSPPPAVIEGTPWFFSTPGETFTNSWSCFCLDTRGKFDGQTPFCSDGILQKTPQACACRDTCQTIRG